MDNITTLRAFLYDHGYVLPYELNQDTARFFFRTTVPELQRGQPPTSPQDEALIDATTKLNLQ